MKFTTSLFAPNAPQKTVRNFHNIVNKWSYRLRTPKIEFFFLFLKYFIGAYSKS